MKFITYHSQTTVYISDEHLIYEFVQRDISGGCDVISVDHIIKEISGLCRQSIYKLIAD